MEKNFMIQAMEEVVARKELEEKGIITVAGRVCTSYFRKKVMYSGD